MCKIWKAHSRWLSAFNVRANVQVALKKSLQLEATAGVASFPLNAHVGVLLFDRIVRSDGGGRFAAVALVMHGPDWH